MDTNLKPVCYAIPDTELTKYKDDKSRLGAEIIETPEGKKYALKSTASLTQISRLGRFFEWTERLDDSVRTENQLVIELLYDAYVAGSGLERAAQALWRPRYVAREAITGEDANALFVNLGTTRKTKPGISLNTEAALSTSNPEETLVQYSRETLISKNSEDCIPSEVFLQLNEKACQFFSELTLKPIILDTAANNEAEWNKAALRLLSHMQTHSNFPKIKVNSKQNSVLIPSLCQHFNDLNARLAKIDLKDILPNDIFPCIKNHNKILQSTLNKVVQETFTQILVSECNIPETRAQKQVDCLLRFLLDGEWILLKSLVTFFQKHVHTYSIAIPAQPLESDITFTRSAKDHSCELTFHLVSKTSTNIQHRNIPRAPLSSILELSMEEQPPQDTQLGYSVHSEVYIQILLDCSQETLKANVQRFQASYRPHRA